MGLLDFFVYVAAEKFENSLWRGHEKYMDLKAETFNNNLPSLPVPELAVPLMDYQKESVQFALSRQESYLALDMGLGKTACAIAVAVAEIRAGGTPILVVCPANLTTNWAREFEKFSPETKTVVLSGRTPHRLPKADVYIIGNSVVAWWAKHDQSSRAEFDLHGQIGTLIIDEAHKYKNLPNKSLEWNAVLAMRSLSKTISGRKVLMSGTPTPNGRCVEMKAQLDILGNMSWMHVGGREEFDDLYVKRAYSTWREESLSLDRLGKRMRSTFMLRKKRDEVLTLPNKGRSALFLDGEGPAITKYHQAEQDIIGFLASEGKNVQGAMKAKALVKLGVMRRLAGEAKIPAIIEHVNNIVESCDTGVFVVAENTAVIESLLEGLKDVGAVSVRGGMSLQQKTAAVDDFNSGRVKVLVGQITAAGVGLTLHGSGRNTRVVIAQLPWEPASLLQAEDRLHRMGQTNAVHVDIALCCANGTPTIDERLWSILEKKSLATGVLIDGEEHVLLSEIQEMLIDTYR
jgi:SWI/SNF-related matrix-associated actin-dependent regulator 1 of chromatin subfamily A